MSEFTIDKGVAGVRVWRVAALLFATVASTPAWAWEAPSCTRNAEASSCYVAQPVSGGRTVRDQVLALGIIRSGELTLGMVGIFDDTWSMPKRDKVEVTVSVDAFAPVERMATTSGNMLRLLLPLADLEAIAKGSALTIVSPAFTESYNLAGSRRAIAALAAAWRQHEAGGSDPFATVERDPFAGQSAPRPAVEAEPVRRWGA